MTLVATLTACADTGQSDIDQAGTADGAMAGSTATAPADSIEITDLHRSTDGMIDVATTVDSTDTLVAAVAELTAAVDTVYTAVEIEAARLDATDNGDGTIRYVLGGLTIDEDPAKPFLALGLTEHLSPDGDVVGATIDALAAPTEDGGGATLVGCCTLDNAGGRNGIIWNDQRSDTTWRKYKETGTHVTERGYRSTVVSNPTHDYMVKYQRICALATSNTRSYFNGPHDYEPWHTDLRGSADDCGDIKLNVSVGGATLPFEMNICDEYRGERLTESWGARFYARMTGHEWASGWWHQHDGEDRRLGQQHTLHGSSSRTPYWADYLQVTWCHESRSVTQHWSSGECTNDY